MFDYTIGGTGGIGGIIEEWPASAARKKTFAVDERNNIGGKSFDYFEKVRLPVKYGPHVFRTNSDGVSGDPGRATRWRSCKQYLPVSGGRVLIRIPVNTVNTLNGLHLYNNEAGAFAGNTGYDKTRHPVFIKTMSYTGAIDDFFSNCYDKLPCHLPEIKLTSLEQENYQQAGTVNYPDGHSYTGTREFRYLTGQERLKTSIVDEYQKDEGDPYFRGSRQENAGQYRRYELLAPEKNVHFAGRRGTYKYYNRGGVEVQARPLYKKLLSSKETEQHTNGYKQPGMQS